MTDLVSSDYRKPIEHRPPPFRSESESASTCRVGHHDVPAAVDRAEMAERSNLARELASGRGTERAAPKESFSRVGIRIPAPGKELDPRAHYDNSVAHHYADLGYTHFAELLEAGQGCAACHLTHGLNGIPKNSDLDLARYALVATGMKIARDGVELISFASMSASAEIARLLDGAALIRPANLAAGTDVMISPQVFGEAVMRDPVARRALMQLQEQGTEIILEYGPPPPSVNGVALDGQAYGHLNKVEIFMQNQTSIRKALATLVHESSHMTRFFRRARGGLRIGTQLDEYRAFRRQALTELGRRPTLAERAQTRDMVKDVYGHLDER